MTKHLWEIKHSYYCNEGNYFAKSIDCCQKYKSFDDFLSENADADKDMNLIFRWDWVEDEEMPFNGDIYYRNGTLKLFYMGQRKGLYRWVIVEVCRADEPKVIEFLMPHWQHMKDLWEGVNDK